MHILFVTSTRLGDAVLSTGLLGQLGETHPDARITVACGAVAAPLLAAAPGVERVISVAKLPFGRHWGVLWRQVVRQRWDLLIDLRNSPLSWTLHARRRYRFGSADMRRHVVEQLAALLHLPVPPAPRVWLDDGIRAEAARLLPGDRPILALAPGANAPGKRWPVERWPALVEALRRIPALAEARVALFGTEQERASTQAVAAALPAGVAIDLTGRTPPKLAAACLARATLFVGNDSGLTHLAAASGAPTLSLFGPGVPARYRPWGPKAAYAIAFEDPQRVTDLCKVDETLALRTMQALEVDDVAAAATRLLAGIGEQR